MILRRIGFALSLLGLTSLAVSPVHAGPVEMTQVRQVLKGNYQQGGANTGIDLRLVGDEGGDKKKAPVAPPAAGDTAPQEGRPAGAQEVVEEVTVETCNCEPDLPLIPVTGGGFPKWIFGLGAIPLICLTGICTGDNTPPPITPNPNPDTSPTPPGPGPSPTPPIPEPATILLLGSGLLALGGAARRRLRGQEREDN